MRPDGSNSVAGPLSSALAVKLMTKIQRVIATILFLTSFISIAFWFGEAGKGIFQLKPYAVGLFGCFAAIIICSKKKKIKFLIGSAFIALYAFFFYLGDASFYKTYNNCMDDAEIIRSDLENYCKSNGAYPSSLEQLNVTIPCQRFTRGSLLEYNLTKAGYDMSFSDWLIEHTATESEKFMAHK